MYTITFSNLNGSKNTWSDWQLIPTSRPVAAPPEMNTHYVEIPGRNGVIDLSTFLTGEPTYKNRTGTWEFIVCNPNIDVYGLTGLKCDENSKWRRFDIEPVDWISLKSEIMEFFTPSETDPHSRGIISDHTQTVVFFPEDPDALSFRGRVYLKDWKNDEKYSVVTLDYSLLPFRCTDSDGAISRQDGGVL